MLVDSVKPPLYNILRCLVPGDSVLISLECVNMNAVKSNDLIHLINYELRKHKFEAYLKDLTLFSSVYPF